MTTQNAPSTHTPMRPNGAMDALVVCGLLVVCSALIFALGGRISLSNETAAHAPIIYDQQHATNPEEASDGSAVSPSASQNQNAPEFFPMPASGRASSKSAHDIFERNFRNREAIRGWGTYSAPAKGHKTGRAFITLLGDAMNDATFRSSRPGSEAEFIGGIWTQKNVEIDVSGATLKLKKSIKSSSYTMGEMQTLGLYGYGRYEVVMRPAKGSGTVSSFFTYAGPHMGVPHDEIDIEFLGADTTKVHFNYFHRGQRGEASTYDLPFDAADSLRLYSFEWTPDRITWYVEGVPLEMTKLRDPLIPTYPGKIMFSLWTGTNRMRAWHGTPDFGAETNADYACISFTPLGENARSCSDLFGPATP